MTDVRDCPSYLAGSRDIQNQERCFFGYGFTQCTRDIFEPTKSSNHLASGAPRTHTFLLRAQEALKQLLEAGHVGRCPLMLLMLVAHTDASACRVHDASCML